METNRPTQPSPTWVLGRQTKINNILNNWQGTFVTLNGTKPPDLNAATLRYLMEL